MGRGGRSSCFSFRQLMAWDTAWVRGDSELESDSESRSKVEEEMLCGRGVAVLNISSQSELGVGGGDETSEVGLSSPWSSKGGSTSRRWES